MPVAVNFGDNMTNKMGKTEIVRAVICEDIRKETSGCVSLMGVITGTVYFSRKGKTTEPPSEDISFFIQCAVHDESTVSFRFIAPDGETILMESSGTFQAPDDSKVASAPVSLPRRNVTFATSGRYNLEGKVGDDDWRTLNFLDVVLEDSQVDNL